MVLEHSSIVKFIEWNWLKQVTGQLKGRDTNVANLGSLGVSISKTQLWNVPGLAGDPLARVNLGNVTVEGHIGSIVFNGRTPLAGVPSNNL